MAKKKEPTRVEAIQISPNKLLELPLRELIERNDLVFKLAEQIRRELSEVEIEYRDRSQELRMELAAAMNEFRYVQLGLERHK